jgi:hypothetical protein
MPEWRKIFEAEDPDFGAIHRGQVCLERRDRICAAEASAAVCSSAQARSIGVKSLLLGGKTRLRDAIHALYESVGFRHVEAETLPPMPYSRADVFMKMPLG